MEEESAFKDFLAERRKMDVAADPSDSEDEEGVVGTHVAADARVGVDFFGEESCAAPPVPPPNDAVPIGASSSSSSNGPAPLAANAAPPPVPLEAAGVAPAARPRGRNEVRSNVGTGLILVNAAGRSLDGHCTICRCAVNRKYLPFRNARSARTLAQGRPMGLLLAFLQQPCSGNPEDHRAWIPLLSHGERLAAREAAMAAGLAPDLFVREREENDGDLDGEPLELH